MRWMSLILFLSVLTVWQARGEDAPAEAAPAEVEDSSGVDIVTEGDEEAGGSEEPAAEPVVKGPVQRYTGPREKKAEGTQAKRQFNDEEAFVRSFYKFDGKPLVVDTE